MKEKVLTKFLSKSNQYRFYRDNYYKYKKKYDSVNHRIELYSVKNDQLREKNTDLRDKVTALRERIVVLKDKQKVRSKDDMHAEVAKDAGTLLSVVCTLIETIVDNTGVPAKTVIRHAKSMIKLAEKHVSEMRSSDVE